MRKFIETFSWNFKSSLRLTSASQEINYTQRSFSFHESRIFEGYYEKNKTKEQFSEGQKSIQQTRLQEAEKLLCEAFKKN